VFLCAGLVLVLLYARRSSLLPLSLFKPLLDWLSRLFNREARLQPYPMPQPGMPRPEEDLLRQLQAAASGPNPLIELLRFIIRVVWNVIRMGLIAVAAWLLITPLVSRTFRRRLAALRPLDYVKEQLQRLGRALLQVVADIAAWLRRPPGERPARGGRRRAWRRHLVVRRPGLLKLWEMGTVLRAYARLIRWGERQGARFRLSSAPREYLAEVGGRRPDHAASLAEAAAILEESLYSSRRTSRDRLHRYLRIVKDVVRSPRPRGPQ
jgi:hypothetical protein